VNTLSLPLGARSLPARVDRAADSAIDLRESRVHVETDRGLVTAYYLDAKPRQDAIVIPLRGEPSPEVMRYARLLVDSGVSVLLVDVKCYEGWRGRILGRTFDIAIRGALDYLVARGHDESDCTVDRS
jgi:hypothetical protein